MKSTTWRRVPCGARLALALAMSVSLLPIAQAQTFSVIHTFTGNPDGAQPRAGLTLDHAGNLYGTTSIGGNGAGTVYRLRRFGSNWVYSILHSFLGGEDGEVPEARVIFGPDGALYGTTLQGGTHQCGQGEGAGCGSVFRLTPPPTFCRSVSCSWNLNALYSFPSSGGSGAWPTGDLIFDQQGNIYGTTVLGGTVRCMEGFPFLPCGTVYKLVRSPSGTWTETVLHIFMPDGSDAKTPASGVIFDGAGNLYGTAPAGGTGMCNVNGVTGCGAVYKLEPSGGNWTESLLYSFTGGGDGAHPFGGLVFGRMGNLYGATTGAGMNGGGTAYELTDSMGGWGFSLLYSFSGNGGPDASLTMDAAGNLYGTTGSDGAYGYGSVFKLSHSNGSWTYTSLYDFTGGSDGGYPSSNVLFDASGNLYGTASCGGNGNCHINYGGNGVVWEITP